MPSFPVSALGTGRAAAWLVLGALAWSWPGPAGLPAAWAQEGESADVTGAPLVLTPTLLVQPDPEEAPEAGAIDATPEIEGIEVSRLSEFDPDSVGTLDPAHGGFGPDLWRGSERRTLERLLPRLPGPLRSATMRDLARRLLLSNAAPPAATQGQSALSSNLLALRIDRLAALGDFRGLNELLEVVPQRYDDEAIARARVEARLLQGDPATACQEVRYGVSVRQDADYWQKALVFCQVLAGDVDQATLSVALMREQGEGGDPTFFLLADNLTGVRTDAAVSNPVSPLHLAMLRAAGGVLPGDLLADATSPGLLVFLAREAEGPLERRTRAAERAVVYGFLSPEALAALYRAYDFDAETLANAISAAPGLAGSERRALLYQAALNQKVPAARAEVLGVALEDARATPAYPLVVGVLLPLLADIPLQAGQVWFAENAGRALYAAGRFERAAGWFTLARQEALLRPAAVRAVASLWPYARLASHAPPAWEGNLVAWADAQSDMAAPDLARRRLLLRAVFQGLGVSDSLAWTELIGADTPAEAELRPAPDAAVLYALSEASQFGRLGETVLLVLMALGEAGPGGGDPLVLHEVLAALVRVGLEDEARRLAIEAALAGGV